MTCEDCEDAYEGAPPCEECDRPKNFSFEEDEAIRIWCICDDCGRDYVGLGAAPTKIKIDSVLRLCDLYGYGADMVDNVLFLERIAYPLRFAPKDSTGSENEKQEEQV